MGPRRPGAVRCGLALALTLSLGACTVGGSTGEPLSTTTASLSVSPRPSPVETSVPPKPETAEQFVVRFVRAYNTLERTGDGRRLDRASAPWCTTCQAWLKAFPGYYDRGGFIRSDGWRVRELQKGRAGAGATSFVVFIYASPSEYKTSRKDNLHRLPGGSVRWLARMKKLDGQWRMTMFDELVS